MNIWQFVLSFGWLPWFIMGLIGFILGWLLKPSKKIEGDLSIEGEGALRSENDGLRARIAELEASLAKKDAEVSDLSGQLATTNLAGDAAAGGEDDETYALEWRNRYLAARVKYLESRLADSPPPAAKAPAAKKKAPAKKSETKTSAAKATATPKVLYTDGPTDGDPDDLKLIKGIGPKFEKDLHGKGVYYFRQIAAWKKKDVEVVEKVIDSIPGRIERDEWVPQAKGLAKGGAPKGSKSRKKPGPKPGTKRGATNLDGSPRKKPGPKPTGGKSDDAHLNAKYHDNVRKFDASAKLGTVDNIVKYLGVALRSRDSSLVACSDPTEVNTVVTNLMVKKLEVSKEKGEEIVKEVCADMKSERFKNRVTFYYLCAKKARKLGVFA